MHNKHKLSLDIHKSNKFDTFPIEPVPISKYGYPIDNYDLIEKNGKWMAIHNNVSYSEKNLYNLIWDLKIHNISNVYIVKL